MTDKGLMELSRFLEEWASEVHRNDVNSFLSRRGLPCLPSFSGINPEGWIDGCVQYFKIHQSVDIYGFSLMAGLLVGKAKVWFSSWSLGEDKEADWVDFLDALCEHFANEDEQRVHEEEAEDTVDSITSTAFQVTHAPKSALTSTVLSDLCECLREELSKVDMDIDNNTYGLGELFETELPSAFAGFNVLDGKLSKEEDVKDAQKVFGEMSNCGSWQFDNAMAAWKDAREVFDVMLNRGFVPVILGGVAGGHSACCFVRMVIENVGLSLVECVIGGGSFGVLVLKVKEKRLNVGSRVVLREAEQGEILGGSAGLEENEAAWYVTKILDRYEALISGIEIREDYRKPVYFGFVDLENEGCIHVQRLQCVQRSRKLYMLEFLGEDVVEESLMYEEGNLVNYPAKYTYVVWTNGDSEEHHDDKDLRICGEVELEKLTKIIGARSSLCPRWDYVRSGVEQGDWVYSSGKPTTFVAFILSLIKAAEIFGFISSLIQITEIIIRDAYLLERNVKVNAKMIKKMPAAYFNYYKNSPLGFQEKNINVKTMQCNNKGHGEGWKTMAYTVTVKYYDIDGGHGDLAATSRTIVYVVEASEFAAMASATKIVVGSITIVVSIGTAGFAGTEILRTGSIDKLGEDNSVEPWEGLSDNMKMSFKLKNCLVDESKVWAISATLFGVQITEKVVQQTLLIAAEIEVKFGGSQRMVIMGRLKTWLWSQQLKEPTLAKWFPYVYKAITWTSMIFVPELILVACGINGLYMLVRFLDDKQIDDILDSGMHQRQRRVETQVQVQWKGSASVNDIRELGQEPKIFYSSCSLRTRNLKGDGLLQGDFSNGSNYEKSRGGADLKMRSRGGPGKKFV